MIYKAQKSRIYDRLSSLKVKREEVSVESGRIVGGMKMRFYNTNHMTFASCC
jgi:hypothetical protein